MTYQELCAFEVLYNAFLEARKRKRSKPATAQYEASVLGNTDKLSRMLEAKTYRPGKFETFFVYEPKKRLVQAPAFVDKVVLHAITDNVLYDAITRSFIRDNYSSQKGKGTHDGLGRLKWAMTDYYRKHSSADGWVLKADVHHFFASIDHDTLKRKLLALFEKRGLDPEIYDLLCVYIDTTDGLPLGYQTSQLFALMYLDAFDHHIKQDLGVRYYGRQMDDLYIIHESKETLQTYLRDLRAEAAALGLKLNNKTAIFPLRNGIDFLGFHAYLTDSGAVVQKLRRDSINRMRGRVKYWRKAYPEGKITKEEIRDSWTAWDAHAAHGNTYTLRQKFAKEVGAIIGEDLKPRRKINASPKVRQLRRLRQARKHLQTLPAGNPPPATPSDPRPNGIPPWE